MGARFNRRSTAEQVSEGVDLANRNALVTGANTGIGWETARVLALRGAYVTLACRNQRKAQDALRRILDSANGRIRTDQLTVMTLDLGSLASVRSFASEFNDLEQPLHLLINNAGVMWPQRNLSHDGFEAQMGVNHLGHFLLSNLLLPSLRLADAARVVVVSSSAMIFSQMTDAFEDLQWEYRPYKGMSCYGDSKLANAMFSREFNRRFAGEGIVSNALHPGIIDTELGREQTLFFKIVGTLIKPFSKSIPQGAATTLLVATAAEYEKEGGLFFGNCQEWQPTKAIVLDEAACAMLWKLSAELTDLPTS